MDIFNRRWSFTQQKQEVSLRSLELLIPAGNLENLKVAIDYGADAVYIGGEFFSLRAKAKNFSKEDMKAGIDYAHKRGKKVYVTANILGHNEDLEAARGYFEELKEIGPDALIISDPGIFTIAKEVWPEVEIHISTQANNTNYGTYLFWWKLGATRVVTARELSLEEIKKIRENIPVQMEIETFVHGAMCMAISGRCLLSNYMTGRDANRGDCAQACRWKYSLVEETRPGETMPVYEDEHGTYIFNSKDLCTIEMIDKILDAGVDSLKIEGRMKGIYYVSNCVKVYKDALNSYYSGNYEYNPEWRNELESISNRSYTEGFYHGKAGKESLNYNNRNSYSQTHKLVAKIEKKLSDNEYLVAIRNKLFVGQEVQIVSPEIKVRDFIMPEMILLDKMGRETESVESANPNSFVKIKTDIPMNELDMLRIVL